MNFAYRLAFLLLEYRGVSSNRTSVMALKLKDVFSVKKLLKRFLKYPLLIANSCDT